MMSPFWPSKFRGWCVSMILFALNVVPKTLALVLFLVGMRGSAALSRTA